MHTEPGIFDEILQAKAELGKYLRRNFIQSITNNSPSRCLGTYISPDPTQNDNEASFSIV